VGQLCSPISFEYRSLLCYLFYPLFKYKNSGLASFSWRFLSTFKLFLLRVGGDVGQSENDNAMEAKCEVGLLGSIGTHL
jgi:hypothetical protein